MKEKVKFSRCKNCNMKIAITPYNKKGLCPAYCCSNTEPPLYECEGDREAYERRMKQTQKYRGLYFCDPSHTTFHFLYALANNNMLFIDDCEMALYVFNEEFLDDLNDLYCENNYSMYRDRD